MPIFREKVDFFFDKFMKVSTDGGGDASVWAVGSYKGNFVLTVIEKKTDSLALDDLADKIVFFMLDDLMKFSPYWQYNPEAFERANSQAKTNS